MARVQTLILLTVFCFGMVCGGDPSSPAAAPPLAEDRAPASHENSATSESHPPRESTASPGSIGDETGARRHVRFAFEGASWPEVLNWLAELASVNLDWQALPTDEVNLTTQRRYTVAEAQDLINLHLLARGFTLLSHGEVLTVMPTDKIDSSLVPSLPLAQLEHALPHQFVQVTIPLVNIRSSQAATELEHVLGPNGSLQALAASNRLQAMDTVANLRQLHQIVQQEESSSEPTFREFRLRHARASDVRNQLGSLLGLPSTGPGPANPQAHPGQTPPPVSGSTGPSAGGISMDVNITGNRLVVRAPRAKMAKIANAVEAIDLPAQTPQTARESVDRVHVYQLQFLDANKVVKLLRDVGGLSPATYVEMDEENGSIYVKGSLVDHYTIRELLDKLDANPRKFEVIRLQKLKAREVAGSISFMLGLEQVENLPPGTDLRGLTHRLDKTKRLRIEADAQNNRLMLWATDEEVEDVRQLLAKLGEVPHEGHQLSMVRVLDVILDEPTETMLRDVKEHWDSVFPNPLLLPEPRGKSQQSAPADSSPDQASRMPDRRMTASRSRVSAAVWNPRAETNSRLRNRSISETQSDLGPSPSAAPIRVMRGLDGRLVITSLDQTALNTLQSMIQQLVPAQSFRVFHPQYASASSIAMLLERFFRDQQRLSHGGQGVTTSPEMARAVPVAPTHGSPRLSSRTRQIQFIPDDDSKTILVRNADAAQYQMIAQLIDEFDVAQPRVPAPIRITKVLKLRYSRAGHVAVAIKGTFRDLIGVEPIEAPTGQANTTPPRTMSTALISNRLSVDGMSSADRSGTDTASSREFSFTGKLSIGIDEFSNSLLVSAEGAKLMALVEQAVETLDEAGSSMVVNVQVARSTIGTNPRNLDLLRKLLSSTEQRNGPASQIGQPSGASGLNGPTTPPPQKAANGAPAMQSPSLPGQSSPSSRP